MPKDQKPDVPTPSLLSEEQRRLIANALEERGATNPCPRCGNENWHVLEGYFTHPLTASTRELRLGGPAVPVAVVICTKCGFVSEHALGALALLPEEESE